MVCNMCCLVCGGVPCVVWGCTVWGVYCVGVYCVGGRVGGVLCGGVPCGGCTVWGCTVWGVCLCSVCVCVWRGGGVLWRVHLMCGVGVYRVCGMRVGGGVPCGGCTVCGVGGDGVLCVLRTGFTMYGAKRGCVEMTCRKAMMDGKF